LIFTKIIEGQKFCSKCGRKVTSEEDQIAAPTADKTTPKKRKGLLFWVILLILLISYLVVFSTFSDRFLALFSNNSTNKKSVFENDPKVLIYPLNYLTRDHGDGWNIGYVRIYFYVTPNSKPPQIIKYKTTLLDATVETAEGKTYPVTLYTFENFTDINQYKSASWGGGVYEIGWPQNITIDKLIPGLPMVPVKDLNDHYVLSFLFAKATRPTYLKLSTSDGLFTMDLNSSHKSLPSPNVDHEEFRSFHTFFNEDNKSLWFQFDEQCLYDENGHYSINYKIKNKDPYDQLEYKIPGSYYTYHENGTIYNHSHNNYVLSVTVGPNQEIADSFEFDYFSKINKPLYFIYDNGSKLTIFALSCVLID